MFETCNTFSPIVVTSLGCRSVPAPPTAATSTSQEDDTAPVPVPRASTPLPTPVTYPVVTPLPVTYPVVIPDAGDDGGSERTGWVHRRASVLNLQTQRVAVTLPFYTHSTVDTTHVFHMP